MNDEYVMLREEITNNIKQIHQYFAITNTAFFVVLTYIFNNPNNPNIFIAMFVMLVCVATRVKYVLASNIKISTYMEVFLESDMDNRNWETRSNFAVGKRNIHKINTKDFLSNVLLFKSNSTYFLLGTIMFLLYVTILIQNFSIFNLFTGGIINTISLLILLYIALFDASGKCRDNYIMHWEKVKSEQSLL